jgi:ketosteroid isomerase-like protein
VGREEVGDYLGAFARALDEPSIAPDEFLACEETVVVLGTESALVRATGNRFAARFAHVVRVRDGFVTEMRGHIDTAAIASAFAREQVS